MNIATPPIGPPIGPLVGPPIGPPVGPPTGPQGPTDSPSAEPAENGSRRAGVVWIAATGCGLLLAAATVFVAVRWNDIPELIKFVVLVVCTAAAMAGGDRLHRHLPSTGSALFHLGALLVPINIAAANIRLQLDWRALLIVQGLTAPMYAWFAIRRHSNVLELSSSIAALAALTGIAATASLPLAVLVAAVAVALTFAGQRLERTAFGWAGLAAAAPLAAAAAIPLTRGEGVLQELGLLDAHWAGSILAAVLVGAATVRVARRTDAPQLLWVALAGIVGHGTAAWLALGASRDVSIIALPAAFFLAQTAAMLARDDAFWRRVSHSMMPVIDAIGFLFVGITGLVVLLASWWLAGSRPSDPRGFFDLDFAAGSSVHVALALSVAAWLVSSVRNLARLRHVAASVSTLGLALTARGRALDLAIAALVIAAAWLCRRGRAVHLTAGFATFAVVGVSDQPVAGVVVAAAAAALSAAMLWRRPLHTTRLGFETEIVAITGALFSLWIGAIAYGLEHDRGAIATVWIAATAIIALVGHRRSLTFGATAAGAALLAGIATIPWSNAEVVGAAWMMLGVTVVGSVVSRQTFVAAAGVSVAAAMALPPGPALVVAGMIVLAAAAQRRDANLGHTGAFITTAGIWTWAATDAVRLPEAYVLPVAIHLIAWGWARRRAHANDAAGPSVGVSSWSAYGGPFALLAGTALLARTNGGGIGHAIFVGVVSTIAVAIGGAHRLIAPLVIGTAALVAVTLHETFDQARTVPEWMWLAVCGAGLVAVAVCLERAETSPAELGRRVVEVVGTTFE